MKTLLTLIVALATIVPAAANAKVQQLLQEKNRLVADSQRLLVRHQLLNNDEYKKLTADAAAAAKNYTTAQRNHPKLTILSKQTDAAKQRMIKANNSTAARDEYNIVRRNLEAASNDIPEIVKLRKKSQAAQELVRAKKNSLLSTRPEGKALAEKIDALEKQIAELQR